MELKGFYRFDSYRADLDQRVLMKDGEIVRLGPTPFALLIALLEQHGNVVTNEVIKERVWPDTYVGEKNIPFAVNQLRKALRDNAKLPRYIETIHGRGYKFIAEVIKESPNGQGIQVRRWHHYRKIIIGSVFIITVIVAAVFLYFRDWPAKVFPQFGVGTISNNSRNVSEMTRGLKDCQGNCLEGVKKSLVIGTILEEGGFAVVAFNKPFGSDVALKRQLVLKVKLSTHNPKFEVGLEDARQTTVFFNCQAPGSGQEYDYLVNLDAESLTKNGSKFQPQRTRSFSVGFAADAGSTPDRQHMEVFGIVSSDNFPVTSETRPCEQRKSKR